uniref:Uncharacterized protein n=1 Tax=Grammatophora oceanica TaxID=210454 RepID=A0A7S1VJ08_9STRA|mmetsp:Transcript_47866/g.71275  ORF Transcript_47866/g.71275 Transcript_47866/m.71275 type:complete len:203 (+) Transcript_47866:1019-1627(+)
MNMNGNTKAFPLQLLSSASLLRVGATACSPLDSTRLDSLRSVRMWIWSYSAASCNCTGHLQGLINLTPADLSDGIMVGNRALAQTEFIGDIPGVFYDKDGKRLETKKKHSDLLCEVSYSTSNAFNLISTTRLQSLGWRCVGEGDNIVATSPEGFEIVFDIKIPTTKGCVFTCCFKRLSEVSATPDDGQEQIVQPSDDNGTLL